MQRHRPEDIEKFIELQIGDIKKIEKPALSGTRKRGTKCFAHMNAGEKNFDINFTECCQLLKPTFVTGSNLKYERFKCFS